MAGALYEGDESKLKHLRASQYGARPQSAAITIAIYTNPGGMGSNKFNSAHLNFLINPNAFQQPGVTFINGRLAKTFYNHAFSVMIMTALCGEIDFIVNGGGNFNFLFQNVDNVVGIYNVTISRCFPFFCPGVPVGV